MGENRTASKQAWIQIAAIVITVAIAIASGTLTGHIVNRPFFEPPKKLFHDNEFFIVEEEEEGHGHGAEKKEHGSDEKAAQEFNLTNEAKPVAVVTAV